MNALSHTLHRRRRRSAPSDGRPPRLAPPPQANGGAPVAPRRLLRRLGQPLPLIGAALLLVAAAGYLTVAARQRTQRSEIVVAARSLPAGSRLTRYDLRLVQLSAAKSLLAQLVPSSVEPSLLGRRLAEPVSAGMPLGRSSIAAAGGGPAAFTLAVPALHALGGSLAVGDRVSVLATFTSQTGAATARVIARDLVVLAVGQPPAGLDSSSATVPVTVALRDPSLASQLALANSVAKLDLLREGANRSAAIPAATSTAGTAP